MGNHTSQRPSSQLPGERVSDGVLSVAQVECCVGGPNVERLDEGLCIDLTGYPHTKVTVVANGHRYEGQGQGSEGLGRITEQLDADGHRLRCCFTCQYYALCGIYSHWSRNLLGYCTVHQRPSRDNPNVTNMLHTCSDWSLKLVKPTEIMKQRGWIRYPEPRGAL